jgi:hypothetical protein
MVKMVIEKATAKNKKYKAIFYDDQGKKLKSSNFGQSGAEDYTLTKDKEQRKRYRARHKKDLSKGNYMSAGYLSYYILWGDSTSRNTNIKKYKKMFKLK